MCKFCDNATNNPELNHNNDLSYTSIGITAKGCSMFLRAGDYKPTEIVVQKWDDYYQCNEIVARYKMKYCPECGRRLLENN